jgi:2-succinyl-5-enolpyruvyl-6-hydroxy-3-cyclohexene-1-carboxylate synthase
MTVQATFAATLVDEWVRAGVRHAVVAPGSRSTPLVVALASDDRIKLHVRLDERSAGFFAIGVALGSSSPVVVCTTSGTAAAELHAAVIEADLACVPIICVTADRPVELQNVGAPQTIDQLGLFSGAVRFSCALGVPDNATRGSWRSLASRLVAEATASPKGPGPVHLNCSFAEPLVDALQDVPPGREHGAPWHWAVREPSVPKGAVERLLSVVATAGKGIIIAGAGAAPRNDPSGIYALAQALGWPVLAEPRAYPRMPHSHLVAHADGIVKSAPARSVLAPDVVVHLGAPHASKALTSWCEALAGDGATDILVDAYGKFRDPSRVAAALITADPELLAAECAARLSQSGVAPVDAGAWLKGWQEAEGAAARAVASVLDQRSEPSEPGIARELFRVLPDHATLVVSSSMPIRDLEWFAKPREGAPIVLANRGANGIDGVVSTVLGVGALASRLGPVVGLLGDLAFFHDLSGLVWGRNEDRPNATLVVIDNAGGGIFNFLPQAGLLGEELFERVMCTPQDGDCASVARALSCTVFDANADPIDVVLSKALLTKGINVVVVRTDRKENVALHEALTEAITQAVNAALHSL